MIINDFDRLVRDTSPSLLAYLTRRVDPPHDAADVLAETLLTAYRKLTSVPDDHREAKFWLFSIARRQLANYHRGKQRHHNLATRLAESIRISPAEATATTGQDFLDHLPEKDRELVMLVVWDGFAVSEAGRVLGISRSTARSRYARAKEKLRAAHESQEPPPTRQTALPQRT